MPAREGREEMEFETALEVRFAIRTWGVKSLLGPCAGNYNAGYYENAYLSCLLCHHLLGDRGCARWCEGRTGKLQGSARQHPCTRGGFHSQTGAEKPMVSRPNRVIYAITPAIGKLTGSDGKTIAMNRKAGDVWWRDAESLAVENTGKAEIHTVVVELKQ